MVYTRNKAALRVLSGEPLPERWVNILHEATRLDLNNNQITDLSPLASLTNLEYLLLYCNNITDISPLASLTNLKYLVLSTNQITDISPLANLLYLSDLYIGNCMGFIRIAKKIQLTC